MHASYLDLLLAWIAAHPVAAGAAIFLVAFVDGLVAIGLLMPSGPILVAVGALIGLGSVNGPYAIACAALGAICGDGLSYLFGRHFGVRMKLMWPFSRHPEWIDHAEAMFRRHDIKGIVIGRFVGATRPFIPAIAGMLRMPLPRFAPTMLVNAFVWATLFIAPGWLLGASLDLLLAVAGRLALVLGVLAAVLLASYWLVSRSYGWCAPHAAGYLERALAWSHRHPILGRLSGALIEPNRPESASLLMLALLLIFAGWAFFSVALGVVGGGEPLRLDMHAYELLYGLRTPWADPLMLLLSAPGDLVVLLPSATLVFVWLLWRRRMTAAWHWLAAFGFGLALVEVLGRALEVPKPPAALAVPGFGFPAEPVALATVVYGFFAVLIARELPGRNRTWPYVVAALLVAVVAFARLYFGAYWFSDVLAGAALGLLWVAALGIAYRRRVERSFWVRPISLLFFGAILGLSLWQGLRDPATALQNFSAPEASQPSLLADWLDDDWERLPERRNDFSAGRQWRFNVQYAGAIDPLERQLNQAGWRTEQTSLLAALLRRFDGDASAVDLPQLPASHNGRRDALVLSRPLPQGDGRLVLRLWSSPLRLSDTGQVVWQGLVAQVMFERRLGVINHWRLAAAGQSMVDQLAAALPQLVQRRVQRAELPEPVLLLHESPIPEPPDSP